MGNGGIEDGEGERDAKGLAHLRRATISSQFLTQNSSVCLSGCDTPTEAF